MHFKVNSVQNGLFLTFLTNAKALCQQNKLSAPVNPVLKLIKEFGENTGLQLVDVSVPTPQQTAPLTPTIEIVLNILRE